MTFEITRSNCFLSGSADKNFINFYVHALLLLSLRPEVQRRRKYFRFLSLEKMRAIDKSKSMQGRNFWVSDKKLNLNRKFMIVSIKRDCKENLWLNEWCKTKSNLFNVQTKRMTLICEGFGLCIEHFVSSFPKKNIYIVNVWEIVLSWQLFFLCSAYVLYFWLLIFVHWSFTFLVPS